MATQVRDTGARLPANYKKQPPPQTDIDTGARLPANYIVNNKALVKKATSQQTASLYGAPNNPDDIPQVTATGSSNKFTGTPESFADDLKRKLEPIYNPVLEVANATNANFLGTAWDLAFAVPQVAQGLFNKLTTGEFEYTSIDKPSQLTNLQYMPNAEDADILDKGAFYASMGIGMSGMAQQMVGKFGQRFIEASLLKTPSGTVALKARPVSTPVASKRENVLRDIASVGTPPAVALSNEVGIGLAMSAGGEVGKAADVKVLGVDLLTLPFELAAGIAQAVKQSPKAVGKVLNAYEIKFGEEPVTLARQKIRGKTVSPLEATIALEKNSLEEVFPSQAVAIKTEDQGILTLERAVAAADPIFAQQVDERVDFVQASLARELSELTGPDGEALSFVAFERMLPKIQADQLKLVDDRLMLAQDELATTLKIHENDPVKASIDFSKTLDVMFDDFAVQENSKWQIINDHVEIPTEAVRQEITAIVNNIPKTSNVPVEILERLTGQGVINTSKGWRVTTDPKVRKQPAVKMLDMEAPSVLKDERSNLTTISRNSKKTDRTAEKYDDRVLQEVQVALLRGLTDGVIDVAPRLQKAYLDALAFTKHLHEVTNRKGSLIPPLRKAQPEKTLEVLFKGDGATQSDIALAAREFFDLSEIVGTIRGTVAQSKSLKNAEQFLLNRFHTQVDSTDMASFDKFIAINRDWFKRFPDVGEIVMAARAKAKTQGVIVKNAEAAAAAARLNQFSSIAGKNPDQMIEYILNQSNPKKSAALFRKLLSKDKIALQEFKDHIGSKLAAQALKEIDNQVAGTGTQKVIKPVPFKEALAKLSPLTSVFNTGELKGLERLYNHSVMVANSIQAKRGAGGLGEKGAPIMWILGAKVAALKAVNFFAGSQSIVLANTASNIATRAVKSLSEDVANNIIREALKNEELMKILLTDNITTKQLQMLNGDRFKSGRIIFKALTEVTRDETERKQIENPRLPSQ
tara:strand:- start:41 stop:2974 length:2934 start_codon:yes stop_codon:yes gene_type:complete